MAISQILKVWEHEFKTSEQAVMLALADHADDTGQNIYPSVARIAWKTGQSERTVQRKIRSLEEQGVLVLVEEERHHKPREYRFDWRAATAKEPFQTARERAENDAENTAEGRQPDGAKEGRQGRQPDGGGGATGVTPRASGVTPRAKRGDKAVSPKPSVEPSKEPSESDGAREGAQVREAEASVPETPDLSFLSSRDKRDHLADIKDTWRTVRNRGDGEMHVEHLHAACYGGLSFSPTWSRSVQRLVKERGWAQAVAACTINSKSGPSIGYLAEEWGEGASGNGAPTTKLDRMLKKSEKEMDGSRNPFGKDIYEGIYGSHAAPASA